MMTLAIDTSTTRGSVALLADGILMLDENFVADRSHGASLFAVLERVCALIPGQQLDQVAIGLGPGSYAGIRIAIAAAIGLEFGSGARLLGIPSAAALETDEPEFLAIGDARRETFYFTRVENGVCLEGPLLATESDLRARLAGCPASPFSRAFRSLNSRMRKSPFLPPPELPASPPKASERQSPMILSRSTCASLTSQSQSRNSQAQTPVLCGHSRDCAYAST